MLDWDYITNSFILRAILCSLTYITDFIVAGDYAFGKISPNGSVIWSKEMNEDYNRELYTAVEGTDGYYFCGYTDKYPNQFCWEDNDVVMVQELMEAMMPLYWSIHQVEFFNGKTLMEMKMMMEWKETIHVLYEDTLSTWYWQLSRPIAREILWLQATLGKAIASILQPCDNAHVLVSKTIHMDIILLISTWTVLSILNR
jgi:hypothetical protein